MLDLGTAAERVDGDVGVKRLVSAEPASGSIGVCWSDRTTSRFHLRWLRDNCPCPRCRHENGQRIAWPTDGGDPPIAQAARISGDSLEIVWADHRAHLSHYPAAWLHANDYTVRPDPAGRHRVRWAGGEADEVLAPTPWADLVADDRALRSLLRGVDEYGVALIGGLGSEPGRVLDVVELFGAVRETNYGRLFDVRPSADPANLADSDLALGPHTDNPYRDPTPTVQVLHCLRAAAGEGETVLVDGWRIADELRDANPSGYELLTTQPVPFRYRDDTADLSSLHPIIEVQAGSSDLVVRFNPRSMGTPRMPEALMDDWYRGYQELAGLTTSPQFATRLALRPGQVLVIDNRRVLHGRGAFRDPSRHLQGCYADVDGLTSRLDRLAELPASWESDLVLRPRHR